MTIESRAGPALRGFFVPDFYARKHDGLKRRAYLFDPDEFWNIRKAAGYASD